ncbi:MAG TPA: ATP-binding protein [Anaerolineaceae bacterium]|nr:ATP-binding protein [Anaerolineaceae bacterium]
MTQLPDPPPLDSAGSPNPPRVRSLQELLDLASGRSPADIGPQEDAGLAETLPFPFLGLVGQEEMKLALLLAVINPHIGGVLLLGPRGTGKTTAVRSLSNLLPQVQRSTCFYGCLPEDIESGGIDAVCPDCAKKYGEGRPLTRVEPARLVELPLNARIEDVVGGLDERSEIHDRLRLKRGILAQADLNLLYVDEVNLLADEIVDAILDAAAQGTYHVRRGPISATYRARFTLIGSMNPEEGRLRPQIMDRFGLRVITRGLDCPDDRLEAYRRVRAFQENPRRVNHAYAAETELARDEIQAARDRLPDVRLPDEIAQAGIQLTRTLNIHSLRAEITLFEAARALAAADSRDEVSCADLRQVAPMALRLRRSEYMARFFKEQAEEEAEMMAGLDHTPGIELKEGDKP